MMPVLILVVLVAGAAFVAISIYNRLNGLREAVRNAFSQIDVQLERRYDLIPNLVAVAQRYLDHEQETLTAVVRARASATQARIEVNGDPGNGDAMSRLSQADGSLGAALGRLLAVSEQYPDLKADRSMSELTEEIRTTENRVSFARQAYNDVTRRYETTRKAFPAIVLAGLFGFSEMSYLETTTVEARERVLVEFD